MRPSHERKRLLIVDDEELLLRSVGRALRHRFDVTTSSSAEAASRS
jgi:ActR/RegA family two-component response regulator